MAQDEPMLRFVTYRTLGAGPRDPTKCEENGILRRFFGLSLHLVRGEASLLRGLRRISSFSGDY
jgi:hypothetical protein